MSPHRTLKLTLTAATLGFVFLCNGSTRADEPPKGNFTPEQARQAVERGLAFVEADAVQWRKDKQCSTCHHGTFTVWALSEAKRQGYAVKEETLADFTTWAKTRLENIDKPRDTREGWKMVNSISLNLALMAQAIPEQKVLSADELQRIAGHLVRHQEEDGSWAWSSAPPKNRPPPFFESDEVATLLATMALRPHVPADAKEPSPIRESRDRGLAWLAKAEANDTTQAAAYRLLAKVRTGEPETVVQPLIEQFVGLQRSDGGWGQVKDRPSDAYATGQALYVLSLVGVKNDRPEIQRGVAFLIATQKEDGSWPMTRRGHPGVTPGPFTVPIVYFGSAWGTLGLMRTVGK